MYITVYWPDELDLAALKSFLDDLRDGQKDRQEQMSGKLTVVSETDTTFDGHPGRFMVAGINDVAIFRVKTVVVKKRVYWISVLLPRDDPKAADTVYEKLSIRFIDSFNLIKEAVKQPED